MTEDTFALHRSLLFTVAYEMLGSASDAEDVVQETWLRWAKVDAAEVRDQRAYLVRIVTAARHPLEGAERVATFLIRGLRSVDFEATAIWLNGSPAIRLDIGGEVDTAVSLAVEDGHVTRIYAIRNPHKLTGLDGPAALTRT